MLSAIPSSVPRCLSRIRAIGELSPTAISFPFEEGLLEVLFIELSSGQASSVVYSYLMAGWPKALFYYNLDDFKLRDVLSTYDLDIC